MNFLPAIFLFAASNFGGSIDRVDKAWCPYFPEYSFLRGGIVASGGDVLFDGFEVFVHKTIAQISRDVWGLKAMTLVRSEPGFRLFDDKRGFRLVAWSKSILTKAQIEAIPKSVCDRMGPNDTLISIGRSPIPNRGFGMHSDDDVVRNAVPTFSFRKGRMSVNFSVSIKSPRKQPSIKILHAYIEQRNLWEETLLFRHQTIQLPPPSANVGTEGTAKFSLEFPDPRSHLPLRTFLVYWYTCGEGEDSILGECVEELNLWGQICKEGQHIADRHGHLVLEAGK